VLDPAARSAITGTRLRRARHGRAVSPSERPISCWLQSSDPPQKARESAEIAELTHDAYPFGARSFGVTMDPLSSILSILTLGVVLLAPIMWRELSQDFSVAFGDRKSRRRTVEVMSPDDARRRATEKIRRIAEQHADELGQKWLDAQWIDTNGRRVSDTWFRECDNFLQLHVMPELVGAEHNWLDWQSRRAIVGDVAKARAAALQQPATDRTAITPLAYDEWCAAVLRRDGWQAQALLAAKVDMGIDVIAEKEGVRVALRCRQHDEPVDVAAIRQAIAGCQHFETTRAVVVSTTHYTPPAEKRAASSGILLLHENQLPDLARLCGISQAPAFIPPPASPTASHPS
jgi:hypothetical protein